MSWHKRPHAADGFTPVVTLGRELKHVGLGLLRLAPGDEYEGATAGIEAALVLLSGTGDVSGPGFEFTAIGERASVFDGRATAVYVPPGSSYRVRARTPLFMAVAVSPAEGGGAPALITPDQVEVAQRGQPGFRREVHNILDQRTAAHRLVIGETFNAVGEWSSYPPHKHDRSVPGQEVSMEEVYLFQIRPEQGFGVQVLYTADGQLEEAYMVRHGDVTILPYGYHPVAAAPGYQVYYLWVMAGEGRTLIPFDDPAHAWVKAR